MSKNDAVIQLLQQRQGRGVQYHAEIGGSVANQKNTWVTILSTTPVTLGVGRVIQVKVSIPHTYISAGLTTYSMLRMMNTTLGRPVAFFTRRYVPLYPSDLGNGGYVFSGQYDNGKFPPVFWQETVGGNVITHYYDMDQSIFMMGVFATGDITADHNFELQAIAIDGTLNMDPGGYVTIEDMGGMAAFPQ